MAGLQARLQHGGPETDFSQAEKRCRAILKTLWMQQGGSVLPDIAIRSTGEAGKPAEYDFRQKLIVIDPKAYQLCLNISKGKDDALAFLIAHEFVHACQHQTLEYVSPGFFVETKTLKAWAQGQKDRRRNMESQADVWGAVLCHLSGYEVSNIIPGFIDSLYVTFGLRERDPLYASKQERMQIARQAQQSVNRHIELFEMANYLMVIQQYEQAARIYEYLIEHFQSAEFYNNLGLACMLEALPLLEEPFRSCPYPFSLDLQTRLEKVVMKSRKKPLDLLLRSLEAFDEIDRRTPGYLPMRINRACAHILLSSLEEQPTHRQAAEADIAYIKEYKTADFAGKAETLAQLRHNAHLLHAIMQFPSMCPRQGLRQYAPPARASQTGWALDGLSELPTTGFDWQTKLSFEGNVSVWGRRLAHSRLLLYRPADDEPTVALQIVHNRVAGLPPWVYQVGTRIPETVQRQLRKSTANAEGDFFLIDDQRGVLYHLDILGRVKSWARFAWED